jgi:hypothetical protein
MKAFGSNVTSPVRLGHCMPYGTVALCALAAILGAFISAKPVAAAAVPKAFPTAERFGVD